MLFARHLGDAASLAPGQWCVDHEAVTDAPILSCPECGGAMHLSPAHTIGAHGNVTPRVLCATVTCGFGSWAQLQGYWEDP